jgi:type IV secretory pathway VirB6-like protein
MLAVPSVCLNNPNCLMPEDNGGWLQVVVDSNPALVQDGKYDQFSDRTIQKAMWLDPKIKTTGTPITISISGKWNPWGKDDSEHNYCMLKTNGIKEDIGDTGELDYITSARIIERSGGNTGNVILSIPTHAMYQKSCWLTSGEGLYIAFFGPMGTELPEIATHLKTADIGCDAPYNTDKNGDGFIEIKECYEIGDSKKVNRAYFKGSYDNSNNTTTFVTCSEDFLHGTIAQKDMYRVDGKLVVGNCYTVQDGKRVDKTEFTYKAEAFFKNSKKDKVGPEQRTKFMIYDKYYSDNYGAYTLTLRGGFSGGGDGGIIQMILNDLERVFVGQINEYGIREGGILQSFYLRIVQNPTFAIVVRVSLALYMMFIGMMFMLGSLKWEIKELMDILIRMTFVISFTGYTSWELYNRWVVNFFLDGLGEIMIYFANITMNVFSNGLSTNINGSKLTNVFAFIDEYIKSLFSTERVAKINGIFFAVWYGFAAVAVLYYMIVTFIIKLVNATFPFIIQFIQVVLALIIGPILIFLYLFKFKVTEGYFANWLAFLCNRFINMTFLFIFISTFAALVRRRIDELTGVCACKIPFWEHWYNLTQGSGASKGAAATQFIAMTTNPIGLFFMMFSFFIKIWVSQWDTIPSILDFAIGLLGIYILIMVFEKVMEKVPTIVDNMVKIGSSEGGGTNLGSSKLGGGGSIGDGFFGMLNQAEVEKWNSADGKFETKKLGDQIRSGLSLKNIASAVNTKSGEMAFSAFGLGNGKSFTSQMADIRKDKLDKYVGVYFASSFGSGVGAGYDEFNKSVQGGGTLEDARESALKAFEESYRKDHSSASDETVAKATELFGQNLDSKIKSGIEGDLKNQANLINKTGGSAEDKQKALNAYAENKYGIKQDKVLENMRNNALEKFGAGFTNTGDSNIIYDLERARLAQEYERYGIGFGKRKGESLEDYRKRLGKQYDKFSKKTGGFDLNTLNDTENARLRLINNFENEMKRIETEENLYNELSNLQKEMANYNFPQLPEGTTLQDLAMGGSGLSDISIQIDGDTISMSHGGIQFYGVSLNETDANGNKTPLEKSAEARKVAEELKERIEKQQKQLEEIKKQKEDLQK